MNRYLRSMPATLMIVFAFGLIFTAGCGRDETPTDNGIPSSIEISRIICNPLAPPPDAIANLTVRVDGQGPAAMYQWKSEAGRLMPDTILNSEGNIARIDSTLISIRWKVPTETGVYMVTVRASVGSEVRMDTTWVMVRRCMAIDAGLRYAFYPTLVDGELFFVGTDANLSDRSFLGYHAYKQDMPPTQIDKLTTLNISGGFEFQFYPDGILAASITDGAEYMRQQPTNVILFPYLAGLAKTYWSNNEIVGTTFRKNQNLYPSTTSGLDMVVWQRTVVGTRDDGSEDLINIRFRYSTGPIQTLTTAKDSTYQYGAWNYTYWRNIKPIFSPDNAMIIYFNDSTETLDQQGRLVRIFEPCLIPMEGTEPDLEGRRALMVDAKHGIFYRDTVVVSERTIFQWNPVGHTQLAFIDDTRQFCIFDYAAETVEKIGKGLTEFVYSEDGKLAVVAEDGVYIFEPGQTQPKRIFTRERASDAVIGINWSPGLVDQKLGFRMVRKGASTVESYSVLVMYSMDNDRWYYASPEIKPVMGTEPAVNYIWMRAIFDSYTGGICIPVPLSEGGGKSVLYYSY